MNARVRRWAMAALCGVIAACENGESPYLQGYVEGEFVYVASARAGVLESRAVNRGDYVSEGDLLFELDEMPERAVRDEAERRLEEARANLDDALKGRRPPEIEAIEAQLNEARAALELAQQQFTRFEGLVRTGVAAQEELDRARSQRDQARGRVERLKAELQTALLGARGDQVAAAAARVEAAEAALTRVEWELSEKRQTAPRSGLVFDTLFEPGERVAAGQPVVVLLPPGNVKVRAFVPEPEIGAVQVGDAVRVYIDGRRQAVVGEVRFISPRAEFTPPVIYSRESRAKLVFMMEIVFDEAVAAELHPGQPVDVELSTDD